MRIAVDVMGGDHAPDEILKGALQAVPHLPADDRVVLVGDRSRILVPAGRSRPGNRLRRPS